MIRESKTPVQKNKIDPFEEFNEKNLPIPPIAKFIRKIKLSDFYKFHHFPWFYKMIFLGIISNFSIVLLLFIVAYINSLLSVEIKDKIPYDVIMVTFIVLLLAFFGFIGYRIFRKIIKSLEPFLMTLGIINLSIADLIINIPKVSTNFVKFFFCLLFFLMGMIYFYFYFNSKIRKKYSSKLILFILTGLIITSIAISILFIYYQNFEIILLLFGFLTGNVMATFILYENKKYWQSNQIKF